MWSASRRMTHSNPSPRRPRALLMVNFAVALCSAQSNTRGSSEWSNLECGIDEVASSCRDTSLSIGGQVTARCCHHSGSDSSGQVCFNSSTQMWAVSLNACDMTFCEGASLGVHVVCCHTTLTGEAIEHAKSRSKAKTTDVLHHAENGLLAALNVHCDTHMLTSC